jgi:Family of unknown function (DUF5719)
MTDDGMITELPDEPVEQSAAAPRSTGRAVAVISARVVTGLVATAVAVVVVAASGLVHAPTVSAKAPAITVSPIPATQQLVCPGAALTLADASGEDATTASAIGRPSTRYEATGGSATVAPLAESEAGTGGTPAAPLVVTAPPGADSTDELLVAGGQSQSADEGEARGFLAAACTPAAGVSWIVGGSTAVGRTSLLSLSNPTEVPATVDLAIWSERGAIVAPGMTGIVVAAGSQRVFSLAGFAPGIESPAIRVTSRGGQVAASLQQTTVRGLEPGGVDLIGAAASPAVSTVIPGFSITALDALQARLGEDGYADLNTVLRVLVPGNQSTTARVRVIPQTAGAEGISFSVDLEPGRVVDLAVDELAVGNYSVAIDSVEPIVAALRVSTVGGSANDFAWMAATRPLSTEALVAVAPGLNPVVQAFNPTQADAQVTLTAIGGADLSLLVPAGASASLPVVAGMSYRLTGFDELAASVTYASDGAIGGYSVLPASIAAGDIVVHPR